LPIGFGVKAHSFDQVRFITTQGCHM